MSVRMIVSNTKLDGKSLAYAAGVLTEAFREDPLYKEIFKNERELRGYMGLMLRYYNKKGEIHTAYADDRIVAVSLWNPRFTKFVTVPKMLKCGMFKDLLLFYTRTSIRSIIRLKYEVIATERYHYDREHDYLFMIGSVMKGAGHALIKYAIAKSGDCPVYLEDSNRKDNASFYKQLGFHLLKQIHVMGVPLDLLTNSKGGSAYEENNCQCVNR